MGYICAMHHDPFHLQQTVQEVLKESPSTCKAFRSLKTQCVGCPLARFCTLKDVAEAYSIPPQALLEELAAEASEKSVRSKS